MSLILEYIDATGLNLYAMLYGADNDGSALRYQIDQTMASFSNAVQTTGFFIDLNENSIRKGTYFSDAIDGMAPTAFNQAQDFTLVIYEKLGTDENVATDLTKAYKSIVWDGHHDIDTYLSPKIGGGRYLGSYNYGHRVNFYILPTNEFGAVDSPDTSYFGVFNPSGALVASGTFDAFNDVALSGTFLCSGNAFINGNYAIHTTGSFASLVTSEQFTFTVASTGTATSVAVDVISSLGWATGIVDTGAATTTTFATTLPSTANDHYNGQICYITSGVLKGVGRIVSDYVGASRTLILNKGFGSAPASGVPIVIFPIGGELGL